MANPDEVYPVDLQTAGAGQADTPPGGLVDALRSQGTPPAGLMEALRPPQLTGPSMAAYAATAGLNPTGINPVQRQQNIQQEMQMQQVGMIQRAQEHQQQLQMQKSAAAAGVLKDMLFGANAIQDKGARTGLAKQNAGLLTQITGQQIPQSVVDQWATGGPNQKSQKRLAELVSVADIARDPQEKAQALQEAQKFFMENGGTPQDWGSTYKLMSNPSFLKAAGLPSMEQNQMAATKSKEEQTKAWFNANPQFASVKGQEKAPGLATEFAQNVLHQDPTTLDAANPDDVPKLAAMKAYVELGLAKERKREGDLKQEEKQAESDMMERRQKNVAAFTAGLKAEAKIDAPMTIGQQLQVKKVLDNGSQRVLLVENIDNILKSLPEMTKAGLLPTGNSALDATMPWIKRNSSEKNNKLWTDFQLNWAPLVVGQIDRTLKDEKAARSIQAFGGVFKIGENPPPATSLEHYLKFVRNQVLQAGQRDIQGMKSLRFPSEATDALENVYAPLGQPGPLGGSEPSTAPPGFKKVQ